MLLGSPCVTRLIGTKFGGSDFFNEQNEKHPNRILVPETINQPILLSNNSHVRHDKHSKQ